MVITKLTPVRNVQLIRAAKKIMAFYGAMVNVPGNMADVPRKVIRIRITYSVLNIYRSHGLDPLLKPVKCGVLVGMAGRPTKRVDTCEECIRPQLAAWCNGECVWKHGRCTRSIILDEMR